IGAPPLPSMTRAPTKATTPASGSCANAGVAIAASAKVAITTAYFTLTFTFPLFNFSTFPLSELSPSRLFVGIDAKRHLPHNLVREQWIRRVELAGARIAEKALELALLEHTEAAREIQRAVGDAERALD